MRPWLRRHVQARDRDPGASLALISVVLAVFLVGFVVLLWAIGLFDFDKRVTAGNAQVYAAVLALLGGVFATAFTFAAALLKYSVDVQTLRQAHETELRTAGQADEAEQRLRLETAIRAVELLTEDGKEALPTRQAGALFVLGNLNQHEFALTLLGELWPRNEVLAAAAVVVIDRALLSGNPQIETDAALLLAANARSLVQSSSCYEWPSCISFKWTNKIDRRAREALLDALIEVLAAKTKSDWDAGCANSILLHLDIIRRTDDEAHIKNGAALAMRLLLDSDLLDGITALFGPHGEVSVGELRKEVTQALESTGDEISDLLEQKVNDLRGRWGDDAKDVLPAASVPGFSKVEPTPGTTSRRGQ
jgi:hypothetical protein